MDPISQGVLGAAAAQITPHQPRPHETTNPANRHRSPMLVAAVVGAIAGMAPDIDVFIQSSHDPLLFLEYHRQFTHSLLFIPFGAAICALALNYFVRRYLTPSQLYLLCFAGYATHALLDACTSYGTMLWWPFSDVRIAWNNVAVVDPAFTLPAIGLVSLALIKQRRLFAALAFVWMLSYLLLGVIQRDRALAVGNMLIAGRGHTPLRVEVKPSFGNLLLWKLVYEYDDNYYVDAIRVATTTTVFAGHSAPKLDLSIHFQWLEPDCQQARDIERFRWFSDDFLAIDPHHENGIVDVRYSMVPNEIRGLWSIQLSPSAGADAHVDFLSFRTLPAERRRKFFNMLLPQTSTTQ